MAKRLPTNYWARSQYKYNTFSRREFKQPHWCSPPFSASITKNHELAIIEMGANHVGRNADLCSICEPNYGLLPHWATLHLEGFGGVHRKSLGQENCMNFIQKKWTTLPKMRNSEVLKEMA